MKYSFLRGLLATAILGTAAVAGSASAQTSRIGALSLEKVRVLPDDADVSVGRAYVTITNTGDRDDRLIAVSLPAAKPDGEAGEIRTRVLQDGVWVPGKLTEGVLIPSGKTVTFEPDSAYIVIAGLQSRLSEGSRLPLVFTFENSGELEILAAIEARAVAGKKAGASVRKRKTVKRKVKRRKAVAAKRVRRKRVRKKTVRRKTTVRRATIRRGSY